MKIPFDIKYRPQIESGEYKVETGDGKPVRIICWDKEIYGGRFEIVALVPTPQGDTETVQLYCPDGTFIASPWNEKFKLFIITPEPELTELEKAVIDYKYGGHDSSLFDPGYFDKARNEAAEILELAKKELVDYMQLQADDEINEAYYRGKAAALKDLPRWKKIGRGNNYSSEVKFAINGRYLEMNDTLNDVYEMKLLDIEKMPKED